MSTAKKRSPTGFRVTGVDYSTYLEIRASRGNRGYRMTYRDGVLWIMSPEFRHEKGAHDLNFLIIAYATVTNLNCQPAGSTTFHKGVRGMARGNGKEGDQTYYLGALAAQVRPKDDLNLTTDPPPSLWIEVDNYGDSRGKLPLYAALGVPEVWQYRVRRRTLKFWRLVDGAHAELAESLALPGLTPAIVLELLEEADKLGQIRWFQWMCADWFPQNRALFPDFQGRQP